jgi:hypothetical protein
MIRCPQCGQKHEYRTDNPARPFCSERCKLIDLGAWAAGKYSIAGAEVDPFAQEPSLEYEQPEGQTSQRRLHS